MNATNDQPGNCVSEPVSPQAFLALLEQQAELYVKLESLASKQRLLVTREETEALLQLLEDRQKLARKLVAIESELTPIRRNWSSYQRELSESDRAEAQRLFGETVRRLERVMEADGQDARMLEARKQMSARLLRSGRSTGAALAAYSGAAARAGGGGRLDRES